jgi:hypothetical protein
MFDKILSMIAYAMVANMLNMWFPGFIMNNFRTTSIVLTIAGIALGFFFPISALYAGLLIVLMVGLGMYNYNKITI